MLEFKKRENETLNDLLKFFLLMTKMLFIFFCFCMLLGILNLILCCEPIEENGICETFQLRCIDNVIEICDKEKQWNPILDCSETAITIDSGIISVESFCCCSEDSGFCDCMNEADCNGT